MEIYADWTMVHSDDIGLEARRNPRDPEEYGVNRVGVGKEVMPMLFLPRGTLQEIASELSLEKGNQLMLRRIHESSLQKGEYQKFLEDGFNICELNAFLKATYIKEEERYNKWFAKKREY